MTRKEIILPRAKALRLSMRGTVKMYYELGVTGEQRNRDEYGCFEELAAVRYGNATVFVWVCVDSESNVLCIAE